MIDTVEFLLSTFQLIKYDSKMKGFEVDEIFHKLHFKIPAMHIYYFPYSALSFQVPLACATLANLYCSHVFVVF